MRSFYALALLACVAACGGSGDPGTAASWTRSADDAFALGERLAADPATAGDAVQAFREAGADYVRAFRFEEPVPERAARRAQLALRIGRAWAAAARLGTQERLRSTHGDRALFWFGHALRLQPDLHAALLARARLFDSDIPDVRDLTRALEAYEGYVAAYAAVGQAGPPVTTQLQQAQKRIEALKGP